MLKSIQNDYLKEGIAWSHISFPDNVNILELIEGNLGIISVLNDQAKLASSSDERVAEVLKANHMGKADVFGVSA